MKKKILLLDTNFSAKPIYDALVATGSEVFVIGGNPNDFLAKTVENYIESDYSKINEVRTLIKDISIDYIVPGGNDFSYKVCSELNVNNDFFNIDSSEVYEIINNKEEFRKFANELGIHVPELIDVKNIIPEKPIIVKPIDAYSGHGITIISDQNRNKITEAINLAKSFSKSKKYLIEEYVQGQLFSHSAFIKEGEIMIDFIVEEHCTANKFVVDTSYVCSDFDLKVLNQIRKDISLMAKSLKLNDGLIHSQFIYNSGKFWIIEVTRRCPGDLYSKLIEYSTGFPYAEYYAKPFINSKYNDINSKLSIKSVIRHTISLKDDGFFNSLTINYPVNVLNFLPLAIAGDKIKKSPFGRIGLLFISPVKNNDFVCLLDSTINRSLYKIN